MKELIDRGYRIFSQKLNKWFIYFGICSFALFALLAFVSGVSTPGQGQEVLYYLVYLVFEGLTIAGIIIGHYRSREPLLLVSIIVFLVFLTQKLVLGPTFGVSILEYASTAYVLQWIFGLINAISVGFLLVFLVLAYLFKIKKVSFALKLSFFISLFTGLLSWVFGIVYAANDGGWFEALDSLLITGSLLMLPGLFEELLPGELDMKREEKEEIE